MKKLEIFIYFFLTIQLQLIIKAYQQILVKLTYI